MIRGCGDVTRFSSCSGDSVGFGQSPTNELPCDQICHTVDESLVLFGSVIVAWAYLFKKGSKCSKMLIIIFISIGIYRI